LHAFVPAAWIDQMESLALTLFTTKSHNALSADSGETVMNVHVSILHCVAAVYASSETYP